MRKWLLTILLLVLNYSFLWVLLTGMVFYGFILMLLSPSSEGYFGRYEYMSVFVYYVVTIVYYLIPVSLFFLIKKLIKSLKQQNVLFLNKLQLFSFPIIFLWIVISFFK